ncbi:MAG: purine-binding chemotaxis protein CheW [Deltaproteobacteria bacterium]|nr:purine-binding chemotaxis protein CheW [Deltaproteobacteria bacterium]
MTDSIIPLTRGPGVLARQSKAPEKDLGDQSGPVGFLCFNLGEQEYGIDLDLVCQIVKPPPLTWVPRMDPHILGIVSIRGAVVTLIDLRQLMDLEPTPWPRSARVLIVELEDEQIGLLVDSVTHVRRIDVDDLEMNPSLKEGQRADHVLYVARPKPDELIIIVDLDTIIGEKIK